MTASRRAGIAAAFVAAMASACGGAGRGTVQTSPQPVTQGPVVLSGAAKARADSARYPYTEADIHFMTGMIAHHAQAIKMAGWAGTHGASASVKTLCDRIINAQQDEITNMQRWLRDRRQPVPEPNPNGMTMVMN